MRRFREYVAKNAVAIWFLGGAVVFGGLYYYSAHETAKQAKCQAQYNANFTETSRIRSELITARLDASDSLLQGVSAMVLDPPGPNATDQELAQRQADSLELFRAYNRSVRENEALRAANQLPEAPNC